MNRSPLRQALVLISILATIVINALANALPINGLQTGEISDRFQVFFVPAGYVFSIWGLIYLGLIAYGIYQALPAQRSNPRLAAIDALVVVGAVANIAWILLWHYEMFPLTIVAMLALLATLIGVYLRLGIRRNQVTTQDRWLVHLPFSIYLGWITVATIANITSLLDYLNWNGWGIAPETWFLIVLAAALAIAGLMARSRGDVAYLLVLVWAFAGIAVKHAGVSLVSAAAWIATGAVALLIALILLRGGRRAIPLPPA